MAQEAIRGGSITPEEWRVAEVASTGRVTKEIADCLCKSASTVTGQIQSIYTKKGLPRNLSSLVIWVMCIKHGLELPEFMRKAGATLLLMLTLATVDISINVEDDKDEMRKYGKRVRRKNEVKQSIYLDYE